MEFNLEAYFERIGYEGVAEVDFGTLKKLSFLHTQTLPFENLNPFLGIPVKIDQTSLQNKMVQKQRGGYCYEHNLLFCYALQAMGLPGNSAPSKGVKTSFRRGYPSENTYPPASF